MHADLEVLGGFQPTKKKNKRRFSRVKKRIWRKQRVRENEKPVVTRRPIVRSELDGLTQFLNSGPVVERLMELEAPEPE